MKQELIEIHDSIQEIVDRLFVNNFNPECNKLYKQLEKLNSIIDKIKE